MKLEQAEALIRAHYQRDQVRFEHVAHQVAAGIKDPHRRERLQKLVKSQPYTLQALPIQTRQLLYDLSPFDPQQLWMGKQQRAEFERFIDEQRYRSELESRGLPPRRSVLLHGPPGNGKTSAASSFATALKWPGYGVRLSSVRASLLGETAANLAQAWQVLEGQHVLLLDEIDAIGEQRVTGTHREMNAIVATLLHLLEQPRQGILVAATNRRDMIDAAALRRFDLELEFKRPSHRALEAYAVQLLERFGIQRPDGWSAELGPESSFATVERQVTDLARSQIIQEAKGAID